MSLAKYTLLPFITLFIIVSTFGGCDNRVSEPSADNNEIDFVQTPLVYTNATTKGPTTQSQTTHSGSRYYCLVSTLRPGDDVLAYQYEAFDLHIPKGMLKQVQKQGGSDQWVTYEFGDREATTRFEADTLRQGGLVRLAHCNLPPSHKIQMKVKNQLIKFGSNSWAGEHHQQHPGAGKAAGQGGDTTSGVQCAAYWVFKINGQTVQILGCAEWEFVNDNDDKKLQDGPNPGASRDGDLCNPLPDGSVPEGCIEIKDPCDTGNPILDDPKVQEALSKLWEDSNYGSDDNPNAEGLRIEQSGFILPGQNGGNQMQRLSSSLINDQGPCFIDFKMSKNIPSNAIYVHVHPYSYGEKQKNCRPNQTLTYIHKPHQKDRRALAKMGIDGIVIDAEKIILYDEHGVKKKFDRCGY